MSKNYSKDLPKWVVDHRGEEYNGLKIVGFDYESYHLEQKRVEDGKIKRAKIKWIFQCECGKSFSTQISKIKSGHTKSCGRCSGYLAESHPHLIKYLKDKAIAEKVTHGACKTKVVVFCPECGFEKEIIVNNLVKRGFQCNRCSDGKSYAEKFVLNILKLSDLKITPEYVPEWSNGKRYDYYIESESTIIEVHGEQHYRYTGFNRTLEEEQENDIYKRDLAIENGIKQYIVVDAKETNLEYLKNSVLNSGMLDLLNASTDIDWIRVAEASEKSIMVQAWELKRNNPNISTIKASNLLDIAVCTVTEYWKRGNSLGRCTYDPNESVKKKVQCGGMIFESIKNCANHYGVNAPTMQNWVNGKRKMPQEFTDLGLKLG